MGSQNWVSRYLDVLDRKAAAEQALRAYLEAERQTGAQAEPDAARRDLQNDVLYWRRRATAMLAASLDDASA